MPASRQKLPFMFEVLDDRGIIENQYILPINPESYTLSRPTRASVTMTKAGAFEDNVGYGIPKIKISGVFGIRGTKYPGSGAVHLAGDKKTGLALFLELEAIFADFHAQFAAYDIYGAENKKPLGAKKPVLHFYDYCNRDYFRVQLNQFTLTKDIQRRMMYQYNLDMTVLGRILPSIDEQAMISIYFNFGTLPAKTGWLMKALNAYAAVMSVVSTVLTVMATVEANVKAISTAVTALRNGVSKVINVAFSLVVSTINATQAIIHTISSFSDIPHEITRGLRDVERALLSLKAEEQLFIETTVIPERSGTLSASDNPEILTGASILDSTIASETVPEESLFSNTQETVLLSATEIALTDGDTIQTVAGKNNVRWQDVVAINGLTFPYIGQTEEDRYSPALYFGTVLDTAYAGSRTIEVATFDGSILPGEIILFRANADTISVGDIFAEVAAVDDTTVTLTEELIVDILAGTPISTHADRYSILIAGESVRIPGTTIGQNFASAGSTFEESAYGIDELLDADGFMVATPSGDIATVGGIANLEMAIRHRIATTRGELKQLSHEGYGSRLPEIVGKISNEMWQERALFEAELAVLQDPRVESVLESSFQTEGISLYVDVRCKLVGRSNPEQMRLLVA